MGGGISQDLGGLEEAQKVVRDLESVIACTSMLMGLNPRFIKFPDMYSIFDFEMPLNESDFGGGRSDSGSDTEDEEIKALRALRTELKQFRLTEEGRNAGGGGPRKGAQGGGSSAEEGGAKAGEDEDGEGDSGVFVFKGTISPSAEVKAARRNRPGPKPAFIVVVPEVGTVKLRTVNEPNKDGWTPLHACAHSIDMVEAAKALIQEILKRGESLNLTTKKGPGSLANGYTPLHVASAYGIYETVDALIQAGATVNSRNSLGQSPLHEVCYRGFSEIAHLLISATGDLDEECPSGAVIPAHPLTPLAKSARYGHSRIVKMLIGAGAAIDHQDSVGGWTPLMEAAYFFHDDIVALLLSYGADTSLKAKDGKTVFDFGTSPSTRILLKDFKDFDGSLEERYALVAANKERLMQNRGNRARSSTILSSDSDSEEDGLKEAALGTDEELEALKDGRTYKTPSKGDGDAGEGSNGSSGGRKKSPVVGGTDGSDFRLLGALPLLDTSPNARRLAEVEEAKVSDEAKIQEWRQQRKQEMIEEAANARLQKEQKDKRRKRRLYKEAIANSITPAEFTCPLTMKLMKDPVSTPYGLTYERAAIIEYMNDYQNRCPKTGQPLAAVDLVSNKKLRKKIKKWKNSIKKGVEKTGGESSPKSKKSQRSPKESLAPKEKGPETSTEGQSDDVPASEEINYHSGPKTSIKVPGHSAFDGVIEEEEDDVYDF